jgi:polysaccharide biosynthesis/export protein
MHLILALLLTIQDVSAKQPQAEPAAASQAPQDVAYVIGPNDLLTISVFDEPDLTNKYRVDADGMLTFPLVGRVAASGLTLLEFQQRLTAGLAQGYLKNPQIRVEVDQYKSQSIFVTGEVRSPGKITMTGALSLIEALALAGSPTTSASNEIIVVHPRKPSAEGQPTLPGESRDAETTRVDLKQLQIGKAGKNVVLHDGDTIFVPKAETFYITGQVRSPGMFVLDPGMTVLQALSIAGGLTERGSDRGIKIIRFVNNKRTEIDAKLTDSVKANDTIQIRQRFF